MNAKPRLLAAALLLTGAASVPAGAADTPGALVVQNPEGETVAMPLEHTNVSIEVSAFVARATVEQTFRNPFEMPVEAIYTFPLGDRAAVDDFEMVIGDRIVRGEIRRREEAREEYEAARRAGYQVALLEQERPSIFTQSVANLLPGEAIVVRLRTVETLPYEGGSYRLTFPLVVGPRYLPGGGRVGDADKVMPPVMAPETRSGHDVEIAVAIDAGVPIGTLESPSHRIGVARVGTSRATVVLADADTIPNKDFLLSWSVASNDPAVGVLAHRDGIDGFFTLLVQPKAEVSALEAAPKEITFVVDTSGSMQGIPIEASKRLIAKALEELGPKDTFNLIRFAGDNSVWSRDPRPNTRRDIEEATAWLEGLRGRGGTELLAAMRAAFDRPVDPDRLRIVIFATDGYVGNEAEILGAIGEVLGDARIYCVGIGSSVNHYLLDRMADLGRGAYVFVRPDETADDALAAFRSWVTRPYMTDLQVDWGALPVADVMPDRPRDLFSGQTLTIVGRYVGSASGEVVVRGKLAGVPWERRVRAALPERTERHEALAALWARWRVEGLTLESPAAVSDSIRAEVTALALEHRILTAFTSFVAVDTSRVANPGGAQTTVRQALPMPEHVSFEGIFGTEGPPCRRPDAIAAPAEDAIPAGAIARMSSSKHAGVPGGVVGGVLGGTAGGVTGDATVDRVAVTTAVKRRAVEEAARTAAEEAARRPTEQAAPPAPAGFYQNVLVLAPGIQDAIDGDGNPNVHGARDRSYVATVAGISNADPLAGAPLSRIVSDSIETVEAFRPQLEASARLADAAFRVLADLAEDGRLSPSGGRPALAALMAAQRKGGVISEDIGLHALATWALAEAASRDADTAWVRAAAKDAVAHLKTVAARAEGDDRRWVRLALAVADPDAARPSVPSGDESDAWRRLSAALSVKPNPAAKLAGGSPFDRLCANARRGYLIANQRR